MAAQVGADERAQGDELEAAGAEVLQGGGDELGAEPLALEGRIDLSVEEQDGTRLGLVLDDLGTRRSQSELVA